MRAFQLREIETFAQNRSTQTIDIDTGSLLKVRKTVKAGLADRGYRKKMREFIRHRKEHGQSKTGKPEQNQPNYTKEVKNAKKLKKELTLYVLGGIIDSLVKRNTANQTTVNHTSEKDEKSS